MPPIPSKPTISFATAVTLGLLDETNRLVLHPLGYNLTATGTIEDWSADPVGPFLDDAAVVALQTKLVQLEQRRTDRFTARVLARGSFVQPVLAANVVPPA